MKKILITGANSYIGTSFEKYIDENYPEDYIVDTIDMTDDLWREKDFSGYNSIFHVAGIAHQKETKQNRHLYYKINRDLAIETAQKAKREGVKQFVFLSSMSVYGMDIGAITPDTIPQAKSNYGKSKLQAEQEISLLSDRAFKVAILRPPMVYGKGCKGNFQTVVNFVKKVPLFPRVSNQRSMIYIGNLSCFVKCIIDRESQGIYFPQNKDYMNTTQMANLIAKKLGRKIHFSVLGGWLVTLCRPFVGVLRKAFGDLYYQDLDTCDFKYCLTDTEESIIDSV